MTSTPHCVFRMFETNYFPHPEVTKLELIGGSIPTQMEPCTMVLLTGEREIKIEIE